ncbi:MAG: hypothetical protein A3B70_05325 [Deltaproteobacteria bacterium RIFCSPHIGHO2_02_FULL_40_11]|nr:MAG: hypothetical protein A3B70_05325 [Deltaproteobacteria bacterium RIFCSPHIGHO2_02_FULL_40_11]
MISHRVKGIPASETLVIAAKVKELRAQGIDVISFTVGEPDFDTPSHIKQAAIQAIEEGFTKYTAGGGIPELRAAIVNRLKEDHGLTYEPKNIVVTNGSKQALYNFFQATLNPGDEVVLPAPYWVSYPSMIRLAEGKPKIIQTSLKNEFKITPDQLKKAVTPKTKAVVLNSPSNPTGAVYSKEELCLLAKVLENKKCWVLSDDAYEKILFDGRKIENIAGFSKKLFEKTFIFKTLSKAYAMTGWRVGAVIGKNQKIMEAILALQSQSTSSVNSIAQKAAVKALTSSQDTVKAMVKEFEKRRDVMLEALSTIPNLKTFQPQGAFYVFADFSAYFSKKYQGEKIGNSIGLNDYFIEEAKVAAVPGAYFGADKYLRLSFALSIEDIQTGIQRVRKALEKLSPLHFSSGASKIK